MNDADAAADVQVFYQPGTLPPFWDRKAMFFANLLSLFYGNEGETNRLQEEVGGIESYGGRLVPVINILFKQRGNLLVLQQPPDAHLVRYFNIELGVDIPEIQIIPYRSYRALGADPEDGAQRAVPAEWRPVSEHPAPWIDGFVTDPLLVSIADRFGRKTISTVEGSQNGNNKLLLHQYLERAGWPVFDTRFAEHARDVARCVKELGRIGYRHVVVKAQIGASGIGMIRLQADGSEGTDIPDYIFHEGPCLVQGWLDEHVDGIRRIGSPSMQLFLDDEALYVYDVTEQLLSADSVHEGNRSPPPYFAKHPDLEGVMKDQAISAGRWLHARGYRGTASADFVVIERHRRLEVRVCEINARVTGATYPSVLARHYLPEGCWVMRNLRFAAAVSGAGLLNELRRGDALFTPDSGAGVLPINFNTNEENEVRKGQFLFIAQHPEACERCQQRAHELLPMEWKYDRD